MNKEEIIKLAQEAGLIRAGENYTEPARWGISEITDFYSRAAAAEREACAELVLQGTNEPMQTKTLEILRKERERIAAAIRARGNK